MPVPRAFCPMQVPWAECWIVVSWPGTNETSPFVGSSVMVIYGAGPSAPPVGYARVAATSHREAIPIAYAEKNAHRAPARDGGTPEKAVGRSERIRDECWNGASDEKSE